MFDASTTACSTSNAPPPTPAVQLEMAESANARRGKVRDSEVTAIPPPFKAAQSWMVTRVNSTSRAVEASALSDDDTAPPLLVAVLDVKVQSRTCIASAVTV